MYKIAKCKLIDNGGNLIEDKNRLEVVSNMLGISTNEIEEVVIETSKRPLLNKTDIVVLVLFAISFSIIINKIILVWQDTIPIILPIMLLSISIAYYIINLRCEIDQNKDIKEIAKEEKEGTSLEECNNIGYIKHEKRHVSTAKELGYTASIYKIIQHNIRYVAIVNGPMKIEDAIHILKAPSSNWVDEKKIYYKIQCWLGGQNDRRQVRKLNKYKSCLAIRYIIVFDDNGKEDIFILAYRKLK